ncbi:MAG: PQQ-dependent sugar dehydrogenase [Bacteroidota bacterium]
MSRFPFMACAFFLLICACGTDDSDNEGGNNEGQTENPDNSITLELVNAFPNLSFNQPLDLQSPKDGTNRIFIAEKIGLIRVFSNGPNVQQANTFLDLSGNLSTDSEQGLLGMAFHPNFSSNGYFYVCYTPNRSVSYISRFTATPNSGTADNNSELVLLEIPQPFTNHNGGQLAFGPDGLLYIAMGDGGSGGDPDNNAQNRSNLLGNILRIDVDNPDSGRNYGIPQDNPFIGQAVSRDEIYAYGLRNPWRMSFDVETGSLWTGDVGQDEVEEIDVIESGGNYGWKLFEGTRCFSGDCDTNGLMPPVFEYDHSNGDLSITGGYVYRGTQNSSLTGKYIYGDFVSGRIWALALDASSNELLLSSGLNIASFGTDDNQELYVCAFNGIIYRFRETMN